MNYQLLPMVSSDLPEVIAIENASYDFPWSQGIMAQCLELSIPAFVLKENNVIIGYTFGMMQVDEYHLLNLCIAESKRGQGCSKVLLAHIQNAAKLLSAKKLF